MSTKTTKKIDQTLSRVNAYASAVVDGSLPACKMVRLAAQRWFDDWERDDIYYDPKDVRKLVGLSRALRHFKGPLAGQPILLEDWQLFIIANIFGWKYRKTKQRRFTYADIYVPRKNGKTTLAAIIALYMLFLDGEAAAEVYAAAVDKEQAKICFDTAKHLIQGSDLSELVDVFKGSIVFPDTASAFKPLSKDTKNKDGTNPHAGICDERHAWPTNEMYDVLKTGMGARLQPLIFSISTAGVDTSVPYYADLEFLRQVMLGIKVKDNHFIMLFEPDEGDSWDSPETWRKVNPNYGISLQEKYMQEEYEEAKEKGGSTLAAFCTKNLNMWVDAPEVWISDDDVRANNAPFDMEKLNGLPCYVGIDLASKSDITATALYFPTVGVARFLFTVPEAKVQTRQDQVDYRLWQQQGWLTVAPGKVLDEDWYLTHLFKTLAPYSVKCVAYDPWGAWDIKTRFGKYENVLMEYRQDIRYMSVPTKRLEGMVLRGELNFLDNPIIRWMFRNVVIYRDPNANIKLDKNRSRNKIDGVVALVDAIGGYLNKEGDKKRIYTNHGLRVISANAE